MLEPLSFPFMRMALTGGVLVALLAGYYGPFIVQRRMAFLGSGLAHAAFAGVALGILWEVNPLIVAAPYTVAIAVAIVWLQKRAELALDTAIGIFFAVSMALGIVFLTLKTGYTGDAFAYLFGSILAIRPPDLWIAGGVTVASAFTFPLWRRWAYATFDPHLARADGLPVRRDDYILAVALAIVVVVSIKLVGIILVSAFLVLPAATARLVTRRFSAMTLVSAVIGVASVVVGLYASNFTDLPSGPAIILLQAALFFAALIVNAAGIWPRR